MIRRTSSSASASTCKPRASGDDPTVLGVGGRIPQVNPARAGMIPINHVGHLADSRKPRASGDDPWTDPGTRIGDR